MMIVVGFMLMTCVALVVHAPQTFRELGATTWAVLCSTAVLYCCLVILHRVVGIFVLPSCRASRFMSRLLDEDTASGCVATSVRTYPTKHFHSDAQDSKEREDLERHADNYEVRPVQSRDVRGWH